MPIGVNLSRKPALRLKSTGLLAKVLDRGRQEFFSPMQEDFRFKTGVETSVGLSVLPCLGLYIC